MLAALAESATTWNVGHVAWYAADCHAHMRLGELEVLRAELHRREHELQAAVDQDPLALWQ